MSEKEMIKTLLKQASLYGSQGLFVEAKQRYLQVLETINNSKQYRGDEQLLKALNTKIDSLEQNLQASLQDEGAPELTPHVKDLILELFSFSKNEDTAAIEGAVALAKFGQYEKALEEFTSLMKLGIMPVVVAKNIIRCHQNLSTIHNAIGLFEQWVSEETLSNKNLRNLREFLSDLLVKEGIDAQLPEVAAPAPAASPAAPKEPLDEDEIIDINLISMTLQEGRRKGEVVEFDVAFQTGNTVSFTVPADDEDLLEALKPGQRLTQMQCYSMLAVFNGSGVVSGKTRITSGPKRGDYTLDVTIDGA